MNIRLWELDNGDLINLEKISVIEFIKEEDSGWYFYIWFNKKCAAVGYFETKDKADLVRFKLVERWNACLDMIHNQEWVPEAGTFSSSSKPTKEDKFEGYKESGH